MLRRLCVRGPTGDNPKEGIVQLAVDMSEDIHVQMPLLL